jgi:hypothetical protein
LLAAKYFGITVKIGDRTKIKKRDGMSKGMGTVGLNGTKMNLLFILVLAEICQQLLLQDSSKLSSGRFISIRPQSGQQSTAQTVLPYLRTLLTHQNSDRQLCWL